MEEKQMDYPKVPQEINNIVGDNVKLLAQLFPSAVKDGQVDLEALKEELGQFEEVGKEKYELTWAGKQDAKKKAQEDVYNRTLNYIESDSKNPETTENLYIEGDNLEVLKLLRQNYYGAIKMIYIDPPYNTGNDFVYNDNFAMSSKESDIAEGARDEEGNPLQRNQQSSNRFHANWLNMMYPRLKVAKDLLTDDGVIFISIDDNEVENLKKMCNEAFGEGNFIACVVWERAFSPVNLKKHFSESHDYIICYAKNIDDLICNGLPRSEEANDRYSNPDNDPRGNWASADLSVGPAVQSNIYEITTPSGRKVLPPSGYSWRLNKERYSEFLSDNRIWFADDGNGVPRIKRFLSEVKQGITPMTIWKYSDVGHSQKASQDLKKLFDNNAYFTYPKPIELIKRMLELYTESESLIMDFFSGSSTTAHAVMQLNAEDGGNRKFILVQLPEETEESSEAFKAGYPNICEIGKERIRRAGEKIKEEIETANAQLKIGEEPRQVPDIGFKVFRTADTNIKWNLYNTLGQLDTSAMTHTPDLADFTLGFKDINVVYEVMLRQKDVPLSSTLETLTDIGSRTYLYGSAYLVCLETEITEELIDKLAALDPLPIKFVFRDSAFKDDINLKDETFRRLKNLIERNSGLEKKSYTVEFI
jgi:adenine-specific DNA-methyltransferase